MAADAQRIVTPNPEVELGLCRAALYRALAIGFRSPNEETLEMAGNPDAVGALAEAAAIVETSGGAPADEDRLATRVRAIARPELRIEQLLSDYRRLFGHTAGGDAPLYETEYGEEALFQQPQELADLAGFARAFGLVLRPDIHERIDHVSCECEFMSFLACKESYALSRGEREMFEASSRGTALFIKDHLGRFAPALAYRLEKADPKGFYGALARVLVALVNHECGRLGVDVGSQFLPLRPDPASVDIPTGCDPENQGGCGGVCPQ
jgi:TorA maturation chaperone TorD